MSRLQVPAMLLVLLLASGATMVSGQAAPQGGAATPLENTLIIRETPENLMKIEQILKTLDLPPKQVLIEAHLFDVSLDKSNSTGMDWTALMTQLGRTQPLWQFSNSGVPRGEDGNPSGMGNFKLGTLDNEHFTMLLSGLRKDNRARSLSNPKVTTVNGQQAVISVGKKIPYYTTTTYPANGGNPPYTVTKVEDVDVPIKLTVTPTVYDDGSIRLKVIPEITRTLGTLVPGVKPSTESRTTTTDVFIRDQETLILGGLITEDSSKSDDNVPMFAKIPVLKKFFGRSAKASSRSELVVFITPRIIEGERGGPSLSPKARL
ncbi:MAG: type II secretion system protein GspD [Candidatus Riflebacteria bacterium]|nr:type II secretion system protein GspD [Candidatus Riflebacteria bacterium]